MSDAHPGRNRRRMEIRNQNVLSNHSKYSGLESAAGTTTTSATADCNLIALLPLFNHTHPISYMASIVTYLAVKHLKERNGLIIPEVDRINARCGINFNLEFINTKADVGHAMTDLVGRYESSSSSSSSSSSQPCAFLGAMSSVVSGSTSTLNNLYGYPQISGYSTSTYLESPIGYPLFARTVPGNRDSAIAFVDYMTQHLDIHYLAVLHVDNAYGYNFMDEIRTASQNNSNNSTDRILKLQQIPVRDDGTDLDYAFQKLKESQFRYVLVVDLNSLFNKIGIEKAIELEVAGDNNTWIFFEHLPKSFSEKSFKNSTNHHLFFKGTGVFNYAFNEKTPISSAVKNDRFDDLVDELKKVEEKAYEDIHNSTFSENNSIFSENSTALKTAIGQSVYQYEAVIMMGIAACDAVNSTSHVGDELFLNGTTLYTQLLNTSIDGLSASVSFDERTGSRISDTSVFTMQNLVEQVSPNGTTFFDLILTDYKDSGNNWTNIADFVYNDGSPDKMPGLLPVDVHAEKISLSIQVVSYFFFGIASFLAISFIVWTYLNRNTKIVRSSQPIFLILICVGVMIMVSSIIPAVMEPSEIHCHADSTYVVICENRNAMQMTIACTSSTWLLWLGLSIIFSALYAKAYRVNKIFMNAKKFRRVTVKAKHTIAPMVILLISDIIILSIMSKYDPIQYITEGDKYSQDHFNRPQKTVAMCTFPAKEYSIVLAILNLGMLGVALFQAWRGKVSPTTVSFSRTVSTAYFMFSLSCPLLVARHLATEFQESKYVLEAVKATVLVCFIGLPVLIMAEQNPDIHAFVLNAVAFAVAIIVLLFLFLPKIMYERKRVAIKNTGKILPLRCILGTILNNCDTGKKAGEAILCIESHQDLIERARKLEDENMSLRNLINHCENSATHTLNDSDPVEQQNNALHRSLKKIKE